MTEDFGKATPLRINRMALAVTWEMINKLKGRRLFEDEVARLKQLRELSHVINKSIEIQMKLDKKKRLKKVIVNKAEEKILLEDYIERLIAERVGDDRFTNPE